MADQWYLDLDGTRSGPYPTSEVLSLIEEGEVLPHHRISRGLRNPDWVTILDWRFEQAKSSLQRPAKPSPLKISPRPTPSQAPKAEEPPKVRLNLSTKKATPLPVPEKTNPKIEVEPPRAPIPPAESSAPGTQDATAEMFDLLQNAKQKREAKQQLQASQSGSKGAGEGFSKRKGLGTLFAICLAMAGVGLVVGQLLQGRSGKSQAPAPTNAAPVSAGTGTKSETEVVDRSNEKMTIKAVVEKKPEAPQYRPPAPARTPYVAPTPTRREEPVPEKPVSDKELEELRELKKELMDLKSLKDQLKDSPTLDEYAPSESPSALEGETSGTPTGSPGAASPAPSAGEETRY